MRRALGLTAALMMAACGGGDDGGGGGLPSNAVSHCTWVDDTCSAVTKPSFTADELTAMETACTGGGGTYATGGCPTTAVVAGFCFLGDFQTETGAAVPGALLSDYYGTASWDETTGPADCGGTWVGGVGESTGVESEKNGLPSTADGPYTTDQVIAGALGPAADQDYFAVRNAGAAPVTVHLATFTGGVGACPTGDTLLTVENGDGEVLAWDDDSLNGCSALDHEIAAGATVYVRVHDYGDNSILALYQLQIDFL